MYISSIYTYIYIIYLDMQSHRFCVSHISPYNDETFTLFYPIYPTEFETNSAKSLVGRLPTLEGRTWKDHLGLSENRVYPQWNSHLVGIMISKTIGFRGFLYFQTQPLGPLTCHDSTIGRCGLWLHSGNCSRAKFHRAVPLAMAEPGDLGPSQEITKDVSPKFTKERSPYPKNT